MPIFDLLCKACEHEEIDVIKKADEEVLCPRCGDPMVHICNKMTFKLSYNNQTDSCGWSNDGYASSQYWNDYKKQKSEGKNVRIPSLDGDK